TYTPLLAIAVVELRDWKPYEPNPRQRSGIIHAHHQWSSLAGSYILPITPDRKLTASLLKCDTIEKRYQTQYALAHPNGKPTANGLSELAEWTLKHGLLDKFVAVMGELAKLDPKNEAVVAFEQVQKAMETSITKGDASDVWKTKVLDGY